MQLSRRIGPGERSRTVTGAVVGARHSSVRVSCVAAVIAETGCSADPTNRNPNMVTPPDIEAQILRFYHAEKWTMGTIARQLHIHHSVVRRVLAQAGLPRTGLPARPSKIDAYLPFIRQTLESFPTLTASRLYVMAYGRGYRGSSDHFRHLIACHRPRPKAEAYLRLRCLPGERTERLGTFRTSRNRPGTASADGVRMVLSYSRQISCASSSTLVWRISCAATSPRRVPAPSRCR